MACVSYNGLTASGLAGVAATISSQSASRITSYEISDEINRFHIQVFRGLLICPSTTKVLALGA